LNDTLRNAFYEEAEELFQEIEDCLLDLDSTGTTGDKINNLFRYMHTLKGSSAAMEIRDMAELAHHIEDALGLVRDQKLELTGDQIDWILQGLDEMKVRVAKHKENKAYEIDVDAITAGLDACSSRAAVPAGKQAAGKAGVTEVPFSEKEKGIMLKSLGPEEKAFQIRICLAHDTPMKGARLFLVTDKLEQAGRVYKTSWEGTEPEKIEGDRFSVFFVSQLPQKEIEGRIHTISEIEEADVSEICSGRKPVPAAKSGKSGGREELQSVIRVNIKKLDQLMRIVEELSVDKERLKQLMKKVNQRYRGDEDVKSLSALTNQIDFIGKELQESVMSTRMYTLDSVFNRFPRMIRDLSKKEGKEIALKVEGESTELDRSIMEKIIDPLNHMIRNSVDHGIESPEEREKRGKNRKGTIKLSAGQEQGHIYIRLEDDGKGINLRKVKEKAIARGLITQAQAGSMTEREALELIFLPGFSTSDKVTEVSGRGVGMNVVKENIEAINGIIDMDNEEGMGLAITMKLPLTLAIIQSLLIRTNTFRFVLPLLSVVEIIRVRDTDYGKKIRFIQGKEVMNWRGEVLPVLRGSDLFHSDGERGKSFAGIVLGLSTHKIILAVEEIIGQQQVVIKPLDRFTGKGKLLGELKGISGTVILGDGDFAYVLDVQALLKEVMEKRKDEKE
jgi:two-component system chemotaxis sensor kinase CheA